jgi:hypothetical protein
MVQRVETVSWASFEKDYIKAAKGPHDVVKPTVKKIGKGELFVIVERERTPKTCTINGEKYNNVGGGEWYYYWRTIALRQGNKVKIIVDEELG